MGDRPLVNDRMQVNGKEVAEISLMDRGLHYGDGLFETMRVINGKIPLQSYHVKRLLRDAERLALPRLDATQLQQEITALASDYDDGIIKVILTRGAGQRGYRPPTGADVTRILLGFERHQLPASYWQKGIAMCVCHTSLSTQPLLAGIKHLNRLEQVLASREIDESRHQEGLMCDYDDNIIEATSHNIFVVMAGELLTPELSSCGVQGIMRDYVLELAQKENIPVRQTTIAKSELPLFDEVFVTNSVHGIWPVTAIEEHTYSPGNWTTMLRDQVAQILPYE